VCGSHSKTDDQRVFPGPAQESERQVSHHFCNRGERRYSDAVNEQSLSMWATNGNHGCGLISFHNPRFILLLVSLRMGDQSYRDHYEKRRERERE
jgi:hypothetical protein